MSSSISYNSGIICPIALHGCIKTTGEKLCRSPLIVLNQFCDCESRSLPRGLWDMMPVTPPPLLPTDQLIYRIWIVCKCDSSRVNRVSVRKLTLATASEGALCL